MTTGTFLKGRVHQGKKNWSAGRMDASPSIKLANFFKDQKFKMLRLKTGTPPRLSSNSIDYNKCAVQYGDKKPEPFSFLRENIETEQIPCHITNTNAKTHQIINDNLKTPQSLMDLLNLEAQDIVPQLKTKFSSLTQKIIIKYFLNLKLLIMK